MAKTNSYDCAVVGAGPAGMVAAIYLLRFRRSVLLLSSGAPRAARIPLIRNLIGFPRGISGTRLLSRLRRQLRRYSGEILSGTAEVQRSRGGFDVKFEDQRFRARKVILATGLHDIEPKLPNLQELTAKGLLGYCPVCDGFEHSGKSIALIVESSSGFRKARYMRSVSPDLIVVQSGEFKISDRHRRDMDKLKIPIVRGRLQAVNENFKGGLTISMAGGKQLDVDCAYLFMGARVPRTAFKKLKGLKKTPGGYLTVDGHQQTSIPGCYAIGDCASGLAQISVAIGQAAIAATNVHNKLHSGQTQ